MIFNKPVERLLWRADGQRAAGARFEHGSKNNANHGIAGELMSEDFVHHLPCRGPPPGRAGTRAAGEPVTGAIHDIHVEIPLILTKGDLVAGRVEAAGVAPAPGRH